jgi:hypothetical protein
MRPKARPGQGPYPGERTGACHSRPSGLSDLRWSLIVHGSEQNDTVQTQGDNEQTTLQAATSATAAEAVTMPSAASRSAHTTIVAEPAPQAAQPNGTDGAKAAGIEPAPMLAHTP